jgi:hypothetical protein
VVHLNKSLNIAASVIFQGLTILIVGSTRSLQSYNFSFKKKEQENVLTNENSLLSLKGALSIPVFASLSLVSIYFLLKQKQEYINAIIYYYFVLLGTLIVKKYFYTYF